MKYRSFTDAPDLQADIDAGVGLVGRREYRQALWRLGEGLRKKGYVTPVDDLRFSLELQLLSLERAYDHFRGRIPGLLPDLHESIDFMIGLGQTAQAVSPAARNRLRGKLIGGLKTEGLRPLQNELRVATAINHTGADITHSDLELGSGCDFIARKDGVEFEVEAKSFPIYSARPIQPQDAEKLFHELRGGLTGLTDSAIMPIVTVTVPNRLDLDRAKLRSVVAAVDAVAHGVGGRTLEDGTSVSLTGHVPASGFDGLKNAAAVDQLKRGIDVYIPERGSKIVVRLSSGRVPNLNKKIAATISEASKKQFSATRPGILWLHMDYCDPELFRLMHTLPGRISPLDEIALAAFRSDKRRHLAQVVFSGGVKLLRDGIGARSSFGRAVYNSPSCLFSDCVLLPGGKRSHQQLATKH